VQDIPISFRGGGFKEYAEFFLPALLVETVACLEQDRSGYTGSASNKSSSKAGARRDGVGVTLASYNAVQTRQGDKDGTTIYCLSLITPPIARAQLNSHNRE